jgi:uncharacterized protein with PQ loop repeat
LRYAELVGAAAALITTVAAVPQLWRVIFGSTAVGVSATTWSLALCANVIWVVHNLGAREWSAVAANSFGAACAAVILLRYFVLQPRSPEHRLALVAPVAASIVAGTVSVGGWISVGWIAGGIGLMQFLAQAHRVFVQRESAGVSSWTWVLFGLANAAWAVYGLIHADPAMWVVGATATPIAALVVVRLTWTRGLTAKRIESA